MVISGDMVDEVKCCEYLGSFVQKNGRFDKDVKDMIKLELIKWREASVLCDKGISLSLKEGFYKSVVRPTLLNSSEC